MESTFNVFMILFTLALALFGAYISKKIFNRVIGRNFPVETLIEKLKDRGYKYLSYQKIQENLLPQNIIFNQLWSLLRFSYKKSYYKIVATDDLEKNEKILYLKYYQSSSPFLNDKYYFKNSNGDLD